jgi:hypothetical protein
VFDSENMFDFFGWGYLSEILNMYPRFFLTIV